MFFGIGKASFKKYDSRLKMLLPGTLDIITDRHFHFIFMEIFLLTAKHTKLFEWTN